MKESAYLPLREGTDRGRRSTATVTGSADTSAGWEASVASISAADMGFLSLALAAVPLSFLCHQFAHPFAAVRALSIRLRVGGRAKAPLGASPSARGQ